MASQHIVLLRGINVGGKNRLPMKELVSLCEGLGARSVQTYIQSGNVVLEADAKLARNLPRALAEAIEEHAGLRVPVVMRTAAEWGRLIEANPYIRRGDVDEKALHVAFLAETPGRGALGLDLDRSPGDEFAVLGRDVYLHLPNGVAGTKLTTAYLDSRLGTVSTTRNWRTVRTLGERLGA